MRLRMTAVVASTAAMLCLPVGRAEAQTLYGLDMGPATSDVVQFSLLAGGGCAPPPLPTVSSFASAAPFMCAAAGPAASPLGDIAVDHVLDEIWVTDGTVLTGYTPGGTVTASLQVISGYLPGMTMTGLGMDSAGGILYATDGSDAVGLFTPGGCFAAGFSVVFPGTIPTPGFVTDIDFDPSTGTLWSCDDLGTVTNFDTSGVFLSSFMVFPGAEGIAVDTATGNLYLTDGSTVVYLTPAGVPAPPTFYTPVSPFPLPLTGTLRGLAFSARPVTYGMGGDTTGLPPPAIGAAGQAVVPNPGFATTISGTLPGSTAFLFRSTGPLCPPVPVIGLPLHITPVPFITVGVAAVGATGGATLATPLPTTLPSGVGVYLQWLSVTGASFQVTDGMHFTTALP